MSEIFREGGPLGIKRLGGNQFEATISLPEGRRARECPSDDCSPGYFKVVGGTGITEGQTSAYCPYCRFEAPPSAFVTEEQRRYAFELIKQQAMEGVKDMFAGALGLGSGNKRRIGGGMFSIEMSLQRSPKRAVHLPYEELVRRDVVCPHCGLDQSVYGLASWCADCGLDIFLTHVDAELRVVKIMLDDVARREQALGPRVAGKDLENSLEDVVSIFEAVLRTLTRRRLAATGTTLVGIDEIFRKQIRNGFQNLTRAEELLRVLLAFELTQTLDRSEIDELAGVFAKRHLIAHNLGAIDRKYLETAQTAEAEGAELTVNVREINRAMDLAKRVFQGLHATLFPQGP